MGMLLIVGLVVVAAVAAYTYLRRRDEEGGSRPPSSPDAGEEALDIARRRYAAGEITREEFEQILEDLRADRGGGS
jgi:uncharacterized membrane protein